MWAIVCKEWGGEDDLSFEEIPEPNMIEAGVRIRVRAAGVNFADSLIISGKYQIKPQLPFCPGLEVSGEVIKLGKECKKFKIT